MQELKRVCADPQLDRPSGLDQLMMGGVEVGTYLSFDLIAILEMLRRAMRNPSLQSFHTYSHKHCEPC